MLSNNKIKYNLYYISSINFDNIIEFNIVKIDINIKIDILNILEGSQLSFIFINSIETLLML